MLIRINVFLGHSKLLCYLFSIGDMQKSICLWQLTFKIMPLSVIYYDVTYWLASFFYFILFFWLANRYFILFIFFPFIFISWRLITLQYCSGFCHTLTWGSGWGPHVNVSFFYIFYQITWFGYFDWITNYSCLLTT